MLKEIQGRTTDFVVAADGTVMHGLALIYILRDLPAVEAFKIIQESMERTVVQVVPGAEFSSEDEQRIVQGLQQRLGKNVSIEVEQVSAISAEQSGKYRYVMSKVMG